jgi:hypothetical protein
MPHEIAGITECLICKRRFAGPQGLVIGQSRAVALLEKLANHLINAHPDQCQAIEVLSLQYVGLLRMMNYRTTDTMLIGEVDKLRWAINQQTIAARISDKTIEEKTNELALHLADEFYGLIQMEHDRTDTEIPEYLVMMKGALVSTIESRVSEIITGMRNVIQEPGKYKVSLIGSAPGEPPKANSGLITP